MSGIKGLDNFNRASLATAMLTGQVWTVGNGSPAIVSNQFGGTGAGAAPGDVAIYDWGEANGTITCTLAAVSSVAGAAGTYFRWTDASNWWRAIFARPTSGDAYYLQRCIANTISTPIIVAGTAAVNDVLRIEFAGSTLKLFVNNVQQGSTITDSQWSTVTKHGLGVQGNTAWKIEDWSYVSPQGRYGIVY